MDKLGQELRAEAVRLNACHKGIIMLDEEDKKSMAKNGHSLDEKGLIEYWKRNMEFAIKEDFPKTDYIKKNFNRDILHNCNVWVDESFDIRGKSGTIVALGESSGTIVSDGFEVASVYIRHQSKVKIVANGFCKVFVHCHNDSHVDMVCGEHAVIYLYKYDNSTEKHIGSVIIREKSLSKA